MGHFIMKAKSDVDLYVEWSTVVDAPIKWGPAADFNTLTPDRLERCDTTGTSMHDPAWGGWEDDGMIVHNMGEAGHFYWLEREKLYDFLAALSADPTNVALQTSVLNSVAKDITDDED